MSIQFRPLRSIVIDEIFDGRLERYEVTELSQWYAMQHFRKERWLTDGTNNLQVCSDGDTARFTQFSYQGNPEMILSSISKEFKTQIVSEYSPLFWGFDGDKKLERIMRRDDVLRDEDGFPERLIFIDGQSGKLGEGIEDAPVFNWRVKKHLQSRIAIMRDRPVFRKMRACWRQGFNGTALESVDRYVGDPFARHSEDWP